MASSAAIAGEESPETRPELSPRVVGALRRSDFPEEGIESVRNGAHTMFGAVGMGFDFLSRFVNTAFNTPSWPEKAATLLGPYKYFDCFLPQILGAPPQPPPVHRRRRRHQQHSCRHIWHASAPSLQAAQHRLRMAPAPQCA